jgi:hypothetical protein
MFGKCPVARDYDGKEPPKCGCRECHAIWKKAQNEIHVSAESTLGLSSGRKKE